MVDTAMSAVLASNARENFSSDASRRRCSRLMRRWVSPKVTIRTRMRMKTESTGREPDRRAWFHCRASISMPKTAITCPVAGSITGTKPLTHVPQRSVYGPSMAISPDAKTVLTASGASP